MYILIRYVFISIQRSKQFMCPYMHCGSINYFDSNMVPIIRK